MRRILHVTECLASGVLHFFTDLTKRQAEHYEVYILYGVRPQTPENVEQLFDERVRLIRATSFHGALATVLNPKAYAEVRRIYRQVNPDIVHLHSSAAGFVGRMILTCSTTPSFYTPHGYSFLMQDGSALKRKLYWTIEKLAAQRPATTVACSVGEHKEALRLSPRAQYVNNGINTAELQPYVRPFAPHSPVHICTSGRISYQKNPTLLNQIAELLPEAQFTWIGEGELRHLLTAKNITVTGWVSRHEALAALRSADIFLLPSLWEGLPIALLEAMYLQKLCLVSNVVGNRDVIAHARNGFICHTPNDYANTIRSVINSNNGSALTLSAAADVEQNYNSRLMAEKYESIYTKA